MSAENISSFPNMSDIDLEAAEWAVRLDRDDTPAGVLEGFYAWRAQSAYHREAADRYCDLWEGVKVLDMLNDLSDERALAPVERSRFAGVAPFLRRHPIWAAAAAAVWVFCVAGAYLAAGMGGGHAFHGDFATTVGEQRTVLLPDGSSIVLNTDSRVAVDYSQKVRRLRLVSGEAFFDVASNRKRPFSVATERGVVTALGTAFSVRIEGDGVRVLVSEGRVALTEGVGRLSGVESELAKPQAMMEISAGQTALYNSRIEQIEVLAQGEIEDALDWRDGVLSFDGAPLRDVVAAISRYSDVSIEIADEDLAERRIVAVYRVGRIEPMLEALEATAGVRAVETENGALRLTKAD